VCARNSTAAKQGSQTPPPLSALQPPPSPGQALSRRRYSGLPAAVGSLLERGNASPASSRHRFVVLRLSHHVLARPPSLVVGQVQWRLWSAGPAPRRSSGVVQFPQAAAWRQWTALAAARRPVPCRTRGAASRCYPPGPPKACPRRGSRRVSAWWRGHGPVGRGAVPSPPVSDAVPSRRLSVTHTTGFPGYRFGTPPASSVLEGPRPVGGGGESDAANAATRGERG